jgi:hypothetical protein
MRRSSRLRRRICPTLLRRQWWKAAPWLRDGRCALFLAWHPPSASASAYLFEICEQLHTRVHVYTRNEGRARARGYRCLSLATGHVPGVVIVPHPRTDRRERAIEDEDEDEQRTSCSDRPETVELSTIRSTVESGTSSNYQQRRAA